MPCSAEFLQRRSIRVETKRIRRHSLPVVTGGSSLRLLSVSMRAHIQTRVGPSTGNSSEDTKCFYK
ncbi:hypothetical protein JOB18_008241 [Solea senegalensis]|uniref:Uncharacterized protein n=1 Tax=Solea senegalensis TaxID=28829 RepID=A0AAV6PK91_SOLSE|nr:hypothetical protein JOB18_008241 [Solea senegalensis]